MQAVFDRFGIAVSRETIHKLSTYEALLLKWQKTINLVGATTLEQLAERHFINSAQLMTFIPRTHMRLADMGAGAGFPGMVLAIMGLTDVHLIESDVRKATFLREVSRETNTPVMIHDKRVEVCQIPGIEIVTARALAPLTDLLAHMHHLTKDAPGATGLFLKGGQAQEEVDKARKKWHFDINSFPSVSDSSGNVLKISNLVKV